MSSSIGHVRISNAKDDWEPVVGAETLALLDSLDIDNDSRRRLMTEALRIMRRCGPATCPRHQRTGLVVGYVQSGKTMSFTTVAALARDQGYRVVIVIAGTSIPLYEQSLARLERDLRLDYRDDRAWQRYRNPSPNSGAARTLGNALREWEEDPPVPRHELRTALIVVMKHHKHLSNLTSVMRDIDMTRVPVLVIDDEADQASMNTAVKRGERSTTYAKLLELRAALPCHSYLQYTATPQAPLLINIIDSLSPEFAEVLTPGDGYVGGLQFFGSASRMVGDIPPDDVNPSPPSEPPASLVKALQVFYVGVAIGIVEDESRGVRSMMIHPSARTAPHGVYMNWVVATQALWSRILRREVDDIDNVELRQEFYQAWRDLQETAADLPDWEFVSARLHHAVQRTVIHEVNAVRGRTPNIDWTAGYSHILIGGQAMDRGFTVEGLTVTYMPRSTGVGNADTLQQRARFFGYKAGYQRYCRVYLERDARISYQKYVIHEEDIRNQLIEFAQTERPLHEWKRSFFLTSRLKPTRDSVLDLGSIRSPSRATWFSTKAPHESPEAIQHNAKVFDSFCSRHEFVLESSNRSLTPMQRVSAVHGLPLQAVVDEILTPFRATRLSDSQQLTAITIQLVRALEADPNLIASVYLMSEGRTRRRALTAKDEIENLFQGPHPADGSIYPGDRNIHSAAVSVQLHFVELDARERSHSTARVPALAVRIPVGVAEDIYEQVRRDA